jgi:hypothetical protein
MNQFVNKNIRIPLFLLLSAYAPCMPLTILAEGPIAIDAKQKYDPAQEFSQVLNTTHVCILNISDTFFAFFNTKDPRAYQEYVTEVGTVLRTLDTDILPPLQKPCAQDERLFEFTRKSLQRLRDNVAYLFDVLNKHKPCKSSPSFSDALALLNELSVGKDKLKDTIQRFVLPQCKRIKTNLIDTNPAQQDISNIITSLTAFLQKDNGALSINSLITSAQYRLGKR